MAPASRQIRRTQPAAFVLPSAKAMNLSYEEGDVFAIALSKIHFGLGLVARTSRRRKIALCYFFGCRSKKLPQIQKFGTYIVPEKVRMVARVSDMGLVKGFWPIIGKLQNWKRSDWPTPVFGRTDILTDKTYAVHYDDSDPRKKLNMKPCDSIRGFPKDGLMGHLYAEKHLLTVLAKLKADRSLQSCLKR